MTIRTDFDFVWGVVRRCVVMVFLVWAVNTLANWHRYDVHCSEGACSELVDHRTGALYALGDKGEWEQLQGAVRK